MIYISTHSNSPCVEINFMIDDIDLNLQKEKKHTLFYLFFV